MSFINNTFRKTVKEWMEEGLWNKCKNRLGRLRKPYKILIYQNRLRL